MHALFRENLRKIRQDTPAVVPADTIFRLPERVVQFGTGSFLRGLSDYFIDKANRQGIFNGRIVVVKTTDQGDLKAFERQDNLYTICSRGISGDALVEENVISSAISRVLYAKTQWSLVLDVARNPAISTIISNTTELGIQLVQDDIYQWPPVSFPGKLLAFLYVRYMSFAGSPSAGVVIVPTELISENGKKLESIVLELAHRNNLDSQFIDWLEQHNSFCNSLVDRIVPGRPDELLRPDLEEALGYHDDLLVTTEHYRLWAIEGDENVRQKLSFCEVDDGVRVEPDIRRHRELKLRLLNGAHTLGGGLAQLCGFRTVRQAMDNPAFALFLRHLMENEIATAIPFDIPFQESRAFADSVLDRFKNPYIEHRWTHINHNCTAKMSSRVMPVFNEFLKLYDSVPGYITFAMATHICFMRGVRKQGEMYFGQVDGEYYLIQDPRAAYFFQKWQTPQIEDMVRLLVKDVSLWGKDLSGIHGLEQELTSCIQAICTDGAMNALTSLLRKTEYA